MNQNLPATRTGTASLLIFVRNIFTLKKYNDQRSHCHKTVDNKN
jgi:hypothetical protein